MVTRWLGALLGTALAVVPAHASADDPCGDGIVDLRSEECDPNAPVQPTCEDFKESYYGGTLKCTDQCRWDSSGCRGTLPAYCGNRIVETGEECEPALPSEVGCADLGLVDSFGDGRRLYCDRTTCKWSRHDCRPDYTRVCGDGKIGFAEVCDSHNLQGFTCETVGAVYPWNLSYTGGELRCGSGCLFDSTHCRDLQGRVCGNGRREVERGEECDGADVGLGCLGEGYLMGAATCTADCKLDDSQCRLWCGVEILPGWVPPGPKFTGLPPTQFACRARK